ncbi:hypothetical protein HHI36_009915 [Cryptolaemus montrouzieri]|uniref:Uncharacterized protein n=1 Tax=Cryptolaemus montrouzieri TaxID=559131 RepID=A0ABD2MHA4_9CUCU
MLSSFFPNRSNQQKTTDTKKLQRRKKFRLKQGIKLYTFSQWLGGKESTSSRSSEDFELELRLVPTRNDITPLCSSSISWLLRNTRSWLTQASHEESSDNLHIE